MSAMARKRRILIADDERVVRTVLARLLREDYEVEACRTGTEAVESFARRRADVVLTDIRMPDMDGMQVLYTINN